MSDGGRLIRRRGALRRRAVWIGLFGAAGLACATPSSAAEPSIRIGGSAAMESYAAGIDRLGERILSDVLAAERGVGQGEMRYFDLNRPLGQSPGFDALPAADRVLMRGAKRTYDLFRALGGPAIDSFAVGATAPGRYYLSLDGEGGRWLASPGEALGTLAQQLAEKQAAALGSTGAAVSPCSVDYRCLIRSLHRSDTPTIATVPRGTIVDLEMTGQGFSNAGGTPVVIAPDGITPRDVGFVNPEKLTARIAIDPDAPPGLQPVQVFNPGKQFGSQQRYYLQIMADPAALEAAVAGGSVDGAPANPGTGKVEPLADDFGDSVENAAILDSRLTGRLERAGDSDLFRIDLPKGGALAISSEGPTDLVGELRDAKGNLVAANDDGGERYNFRLNAALPAGTYFLNVRHCCAGKGSYSLNRQFIGD